LAILGHRDGIDTDTDHQMLKALPNAEVTFLVEPQRQAIDDHLWEQSWDMLFFAGHSLTEDDSGRIYINPNDSLTIEDLKYGVRRAIAHGLQLAIFNSCDGLGLVYELEPLGLPQLIVMRQPVPDRVAHLFLKNLLSSFAQGEGLYLAVRTARERLQSLENHYPCASWLPVIFQHSTQPTLTWDGLRGRNPSSPPTTFPSPQFLRPRKLKLRHAVLITLAVTGLVLGARSLGWLQPMELWAYDLLLRSRPTESPDPRIVLVTVDDTDLEYQRQQGMTLQGSLSDAALNQLLAKVQPHQPTAIGLDIHRDRPVAANQPDLNKQLQSVFVICTQADPGKNIRAIAPPPNMPPSQIGFANIPLDPDRVIRRQIVGQNPAPVCTTDKSLSYSLTLQHLRQFSIPTSFENQRLQLGSLPIPHLTPHRGGYHDLDLGGYTILLNYRRADPFIVELPLSKVLDGSLDQQLPNLVRNRIVLIGTIAPSFGDYHSTPIGKQAGVVIHAHMVSQILSAVLDRRPLLWTLPLWADTVWIIAWVSVSSVIWMGVSAKLIRGLAGVLWFGCLIGVCYGILLSGGWVPLVPAGLGGLAIAGILSVMPIRMPKYSDSQQA
jgi:CHASE2 domain-containing sensor protein